MATQTVLIGLDGAAFAILDHLAETGVMPFLSQFMTEGVRAELNSTVPALTPPAWTSLVTGRSPGAHGIFDFFQKETPQSHNLRLLTSRDIKVQESIWTLANKAGKRAIALNFPLTFPAPKIEGYLVPGWMPWRQLRLGCHPDGLYDRLKSLPNFNPRELAMDMALEEKALEGCDPAEYSAWIDFHIRREAQWGRILEYLWTEDEPCELATILFDGVDKLQHLLWPYIDPAYAHTLQLPWQKAVRAACLNYYRALDEILEKIVNKAGPQASVIIASDHGFGAQERTFFVNAWLEQQGYLRWQKGEAPQMGERQQLGVGQIARHSYQLDWEHTQAYAPLPSGNGIHIVQADDEHPNGVSPADYAAFCQKLSADLLALRDPSDNAPVVARIYHREEIFAGPGLQLAPDLTLELQDGGLISILQSEKVVAPRPQVSGTHRPQGVFIAQGPNFKKQKHLPPLSILDVAPLIMYTLGLAIPAEWEGALPASLITADFLQKHPPKTRPFDGLSAPETPQASQEPDLDEEAEKELMRRLRALGYVE